METTWLLPEQRTFLVRLDAGRKARRYPSLCSKTHRAAYESRPVNRAARRDLERTFAPAADPVARRQVEFTRLGYESHTLAATVRLLGYPLLLHLIINAYWEALDFEIPVLDAAGASWRRCVDTSLDPPDDICGWADAHAVRGSTCRAQPRSVVLLLAKNGGEEIVWH